MSADAQIRQYAERIVRLEMERRERAEDIKEIKAEAKGQGFNVKLLATCVRLMLLEQEKQDAAIREHSELDLYLNAVGLLDGVDEEPDATPAGAVVAVRSGVTSAAGEEAATISRESADQTRHCGGGSGQAITAVREHVEASVAGESPAPASAQVSRESASELGAFDCVGVVPAAADTVDGSRNPSPGTGQESPGTLSETLHRPSSHDREAA